MTTIQVTTVIISLVLNQQWTGNIIQTNPFNVMIGPAPGVLIQMGARFLPCVRNTSLNTGLYRSSCAQMASKQHHCLEPSHQPACSILHYEQICGLGGFNGGEPNQWFRFIIPIFLHGGVVHLLVNMLFQVQTGFQLERDFGWWRTAAIYFIAGIGGFVFGGNFNGLTPSVGCSGALFGLMACLLIDLFQNWKVIQNPWWEFTKLIFTILLSFLIGMLPFIDNFAHVGGFFCGIFAGLIFMPTIHYSKADGRVKITLMILSIPVIILIYVFLFRGFYTGQNDCPWCKYINCIPGMPWCEQKWNQNITFT
ncbi:rhomboid family-domain-containing protein [Chytridium lagenaria]|nr:rhomboid family-domain-containing protein [Chytridium lagenaria]